MKASKVLVETATYLHETSFTRRADIDLFWVGKARGVAAASTADAAELRFRASKDQVRKEAILTTSIRSLPEGDPGLELGPAKLTAELMPRTPNIAPHAVLVAYR